MDKNSISISNFKNRDLSNNDCGDDQKNKINYKTLLSKIFTKKGIKIIVLILIGLFALILFMGIGEKDKDTKLYSNKEASSNYITTLDYCEALEEKLEKVLSQMAGAGNVKVMISVNGSPEIVYATKDDNKSSSTNSGSTVTSSSNPIIIESNGNANPLILTENLPEVKGVIVVSSGAHDISVRLDILNSVSKLLNISTDKISVLKGV